MTTLLDGGYYAIKGFNFQYDFTLLNILSQSNKECEVEIEQFEDYSDENYIIQVKYKEKANFSYSKIKKPVCQLLELYKTDKRTPILYAYFKDREEQEKKLTMEELDAIIGDCKVKNKQYYFSEELKKEFISKFVLVFTSKYQKQFETVIEKITQEIGCEEEEALIYYAIMYKYIEKKVIENSPENKSKRVCNKQELIDLINRNKKIIFYSSYLDYMGKEKYYKLIYKKYFREVNRNFHERFFIIQLQEGYYDINQLKNIVLSIKEMFYIKHNVYRKTKITSPAPYILFSGIKKEDLKQLKTELQEEGYVFRDGFNFENADFFLKNLVERCTPQNNIEIKFINNFDYFFPVYNSITGITKKIYCLYIDSPIDFKEINSQVNFIQIDELVDIYEYLFRR